MRVYRVWCEWDVGQDEGFFETEQSANEWIVTNPHLYEMAEDYNCTIADLIEDGLIGIEDVKIR
jgi:hypothetical protein